MFKRIILTSEFPEEVNWKKALKLIEFKSEIYIAVKNKKEFLKYRKKIKSKHINLGAWPTLPKEEGYWFSGFTSKKSINKLKEFKGMKIKIDLEPPIPLFNYNNIKIILWLIKLYFKKAKNKEYLRNVIYWLANNNTKILVNEFPLPKCYLKKLGITIKKQKNMTLQMMMYTSPVGRFFRPIMKVYNKIMLKKALRKNKDMVASIGLIGPGILKTEGCYKKTEEFLEDLKMVQNISVKNIAVYSLGL